MPLNPAQQAFADAVQAKFLKYGAFTTDPEVPEKARVQIAGRLKLIQALYLGLMKGPPNADLIIETLQGHIQSLKAWKPKPAGPDMVPLPNLSDIRKVQMWRELVCDDGIYYITGSGRGIARDLRIPRVIADGWFCFVILVAKPGRVLIGDRAAGGHTTLSSGADVLYAGEIMLEAGHIVTWSNDSGHYQPPKDLSRQAEHLLPPAKFQPHAP